MDSTQRYRMKDLARWLKQQIREGGWNSEVYNVVMEHVVGDELMMLTVIFRDNKRLKVTVEVLG